MIMKLVSEWKQQDTYSAHFVKSSLFELLRLKISWHSANKLLLTCSTNSEDWKREKDRRQSDKAA